MLWFLSILPLHRATASCNAQHWACHSAGAKEATSDSKKQAKARQREGAKALVEISSGS